ncbi:hypothetical protein GN956_G8373 [Arapaima gigas]
MTEEDEDERGRPTAAHRTRTGLDSTRTADTAEPRRARKTTGGRAAEGARINSAAPRPPGAAFAGISDETTRNRAPFPSCSAAPRPNIALHSTRAELHSNKDAHGQFSSLLRVCCPHGPAPPLPRWHVQPAMKPGPYPTRSGKPSVTCLRTLHCTLCGKKSI